MLPFTQEKLRINNRDIFYYNRSCLIPEIYIFSKSIFDDLQNYLGIQFEMNQRLKMSRAVDEQGNMKQYDTAKIERIAILYDFYVDSILKMTQLLYYERIDNNNLYLFCIDVTNSLKQEFIAQKAADYDKIFNQEKDKIFLSKVNKTDGNMRNDKDNFLYYFDKVVKKSGRRLQDCYKIAVEKCQPLKNMIDQQLDIEFPLDTFQDKIVEKEKIVVSNKKSVKK